MHAARLIIGEREVNLGSVWVHLKAQHLGAAQPFRLFVKNELVSDVFDRRRMKPSHLSWEKYFFECLLKFGGFGFTSCFRILKEAEEIQDTRPLWVITAIERVNSLEQELLIEGFAELFSKEHAPNLRPLQ